MNAKFFVPENYTNPLGATSQSDQLKTYLQYLVDANQTMPSAEIVRLMEAKVNGLNTAAFKDQASRVYRFRRYDVAHTQARYILVKEQNDRPFWMVEFSHNAQ